MLGMSLLSFLVLALIGEIVAVAYHDIVRYRFLKGRDALFGKLIIGWIGAWLGSPVLGHWLWKIENVYIVPALLGATAAVHLTVLTERVLVELTNVRPAKADAQREETCTIKPAVAA